MRYRQQQNPQLPHRTDRVLLCTVQCNRYKPVIVRHHQKMLSNGIRRFRKLSTRKCWLFGGAAPRAEKIVPFSATNVEIRCLSLSSRTPPILTVKSPRFSASSIYRIVCLVIPPFDSCVMPWEKWNLVQHHLEHHPHRYIHWFYRFKNVLHHTTKHMHVGRTKSQRSSERRIGFDFHQVIIWK